MKIHPSWLNYLPPKSEPLPKSEYSRPFEKPPVSIKPIHWLTKLGRWLVEWFTIDSGPRIWQTTDRHGQVCYRVYDPQTRRSLQFQSETEVLIWLDTRHYK